MLLSDGNNIVFLSCYRDINTPLFYINSNSGESGNILVIINEFSCQLFIETF